MNETNEQKPKRTRPRNFTEALHLSTQRFLEEVKTISKEELAEPAGFDIADLAIEQHDPLQHFEEDGIVLGMNPDGFPFEAGEELDLLSIDLALVLNGPFD